VATSLAGVARRSDGAVAQARADLVRAVRQAAASGMSQSQIASEIGRSQPEVSRLLHFHGISPLARRLRKHTSEIRRIVANFGGSNVRVFGSVATGLDHEGSDIDLLFTMGVPLSLMQLGALERQLMSILGTEVDLVPDSVLRPEFRDRALAEAVPL
jgi:predicted nucleotidyltransferase